MDVARLLESWPALRQLREGDPLGLGKAVQSPRSKMLVPRIDEAEHVVQSICPYCAVGVVTTRELPEMWTNMLAAAGALLVGVAAACVGSRS